MLGYVDLFFQMLPGAAVKIGVALLCGLLLGIEREHKNKPAGLRTILLITVGSTVFMIVSDAITVLTMGPADITLVDPSRIASQVVSGIGFLGAGAIIQARGSVYGLTTAATIWVAAGAGLCIGAGLPLLGILITLIVLLALVFLDPLGDWISRTGEKQSLEILIRDDSLILQRVREVLRQHNVRRGQTSLTRMDEETLKLRFVYHDSGSTEPRLMLALSQIDGVGGTPCAQLGR